jgi:hypothetical protein
MKQILSVALLILSVSAIAPGGNHRAVRGASKFDSPAQQPADASISGTGVVGEVTEIDSTARRMTLRTEAGSVVTVLLADNTGYLLIPPGETSLEKAVKIELASVSVGDKAYARGKVGEDRKSVTAQKLIVMSQADIRKKRDRERAEWQTHGVAGLITALNPDTREITLQARGSGIKPFVVAASDKARIRRYAPDSINFSDAIPGSFADLRVGDQIRALVRKGADGSRLEAEQIVSGAFRTIGGTVTEVAPQTGEIKIAMLGTKQPLTVTVKKDSTLRRIPLPVAQVIAQASQTSQGGNAPPSAKRGGDLQELLDRLPALTISEIRPGDVIAVSSTIGADPARITAITLVTGVDGVLNAMRKPGARPTPLVLSTGLPAGVLDSAIGQP